MWILWNPDCSFNFDSKFVIADQNLKVSSFSFTLEEKSSGAQVSSFESFSSESYVGHFWSSSSFNFAASRYDIEKILFRWSKYDNELWKTTSSQTPNAGKPFILPSFILPLSLSDDFVTGNRFQKPSILQMSQTFISLLLRNLHRLCFSRN